MGKASLEKSRISQPSHCLVHRVGDVLDSSIIGIGAGKMKITGGSDKSGNPDASGRTWWSKEICVAF